MVEAHGPTRPRSLGGTGRTHVINDKVRMGKGSEVPGAPGLHAEPGQPTTLLPVPGAAFPVASGGVGVGGEAGRPHATCLSALDILKFAISL